MFVFGAPSRAIGPVSLARSLGERAHRCRFVLVSLGGKTMRASGITETKFMEIFKGNSMFTSAKSRRGASDFSLFAPGVAGFNHNPHQKSVRMQHVRANANTRSKIYIGERVINY